MAGTEETAGSGGPPPPVDRAARARSTRVYRALLVAAVLGIAAVATLCYWHPYEDTEIERKARQFDEFCAKTRNAMLEDRLAFERGDERERADARRRFYASDVMYHNSQSVELCLQRLPRTPSECFLGENWQCLADFAGSIAQLIWRTTGRVE